MRAVVLEIRCSFAAVLSDDGRIVKVKNQNYAIGQVIEMKEQAIKSKKKIVVWAASAAAAVCLCATGAWAYYSPYAYVSLDVNPSIEYTLNRFDRVLSVSAANEDGEVVLTQAALKNLGNKAIDEAVALTVEQLTQMGYFEGEENGIMISTAAKNQGKSDKLAEQLRVCVEGETEDEDVAVETISVGLERVEEARALGVTPGKLNLVEKLQASAADPESVDIEEWLEKSVKDIMKATKDNKTTQKQAQKGQEEESTEEDGDSSKGNGKAEKAQEKAQEKIEAQLQKEEKQELKNQTSSSSSQVSESSQNQGQEKASSKAESKAEKNEEKENGNSSNDNSNGNSSNGKSKA